MVGKGLNPPLSVYDILLLAVLVVAIDSDHAATFTRLSLGLQLQLSSLKLIFFQEVFPLRRRLSQVTPVLLSPEHMLHLGVVHLPQHKQTLSASLESPVRGETRSVLLTTLPLAHSTGSANAIN